MRRVLRLLGWLIGAVATLAVIFWLLPRERVVMGAVPVFDDPVAFLAEREGSFDDIRPGDAARIIWRGAISGWNWSRVPITAFPIRGALPPSHAPWRRF